MTFQNPIPYHVAQMTQKLRSVISRILVRKSFVLIGPSINRQRMAPFHVPSMTVSVTSMGPGEISFFKTFLDCSN
jgi:hypothetical protein